MREKERGSVYIHVKTVFTHKTKCTKATNSRSDGKLKSIADNRSDSQANLQQGEDHRRRRIAALRIEAQ